MTLVFKITTKEGHIRHFSFTEHKSEGDYGNKTYISVQRQEDRENMAYLDVRYLYPYNFKTVCENYIKDYFGTRLAAFQLDALI